MDSITPSTIASVVSLVTSLLLVLVVVFVAYYTRSRHILLRRIWQLLHGTEEIKDLQIRKFVDDQSSLVGFRLYSGLAAKNLKQAQHLILWADVNGIEIERLRDCGKYFDAATRTVLADKLPSRRMRVWQVLGLMAVTFLTFLCIAGLSPNYVLFSFKETGRLFIATPTEARPLWPLNAEVLRKSDCIRRSIDHPIQSSFGQREVEIACEIFAEPTTPDFMKEQLRVQRLTLIAFIPFLVFLIFLFVRAISQADAARTLLEKDLSPGSDSGQIPLEFEG